MVRLTQSSWYEYSKERILEWMTVAPISLSVQESPSLYFYFPEGLVKSAPVRYTLVCGARHLKWVGCISSVKDDILTVRLSEGPFRGFTAKHVFKMDGALTVCEDTLEFQGEDDSFKEAVEAASIRYEFELRAKAYETLLKLQKEKRTGAFTALRGSAFAG